MRKSTFLNFSFNQRKIMPIAASLMLLPVIGLAQTPLQVQKIRSESNLQNLTQLQQHLEKSSLSIHQLKTMAMERNIKFSGEVDGRKYQLVGFDKWTKEPLYYITFNADAARGTFTDKINSSAGIFNLDGEDMIVHEWDGGGVRPTHQEFGGRVTQKDGATSFSDHSTHVAGTMIAAGVNGAAKGMAPKAHLDAYDWNDDEIEMAEAAKNGALVSNHSYGFPAGFAWGDWSGVTGWHWLGGDEETEYAGFGKYTSADRDYDIIAVNAPFYLPVKAAGNDKGGGPEKGGLHYVRVYDEAADKYVWKESTKERQKNGGPEGFDIINRGSLGKNILTVGAAEKLVGAYTQGSDVVMANFSSTGPVDDGRIKPDISGIGVDVFSPFSSADDAYQSISGTSMASPNVTGSLLLLQEHYSKENEGKFMRSATLKALATGTASEAGPHVGPDYASGWGLLNAYNAAMAISANKTYSVIKEESLKNNDTYTMQVTADGSEPLKVTIAWTDPAPTASMFPSDTLNDRTPLLVNDLDVRITKDGETFLPWKLDPTNPGAAAQKGDNLVDNVEQVMIPNPTPGAVYDISVTHKGTLKKNNFKETSYGMVVELEDTEAQDFSMVVTGINNGVAVDLALDKVEVKVSKLEYTAATPVEFTVLNKGSEPAVNGKLKYSLINSDDNDQVIKTAEVDLGTLAPNSTKAVTVELDLTIPFAHYRIEGEVVIENDAFDKNNKNQGTAFSYLVDLRPEDTRFDFGFESNFEAYGWISEDIDGDGRTFRKYDGANFAKTGNSFAISFSDSDKGVNDWLFSNPIYVKANTKYRVIYNTAKFRNDEENIALYFGDNPASESMVNKLGQETIPLFGGLDKRYAKYAYEFEVPTDKIIYIGFNNLVKKGVYTYAVSVDDVVVERAEGEPVVEFGANNIEPTTFDEVLFTGNVIAPSNDPATSYTWEFTPNTVEFVKGTNASSLKPKVKFNAEGKYTVTLKATNKAGEGLATREEYINVFNIKTKANYEASKTTVYEGESVTFTNLSEGKPEPTEFKWSVSPTDGVEFLTDDTAENLVVRFNNEGEYAVSLEATSKLNSHVYTSADKIVVKSSHLPVQNLTGELDQGSGNVKLNWERPELLPLYTESFTNPEDIPADMKVYDNNKDGMPWIILSSSGYKETPAVVGISWFYSPYQKDDWLLTPKVRSGAEVLKYLVKNEYTERYDIYVVPATKTGDFPTVEEILETGTIVRTNDGEVKHPEFEEVSVDISEATGQDFHIAFHHRTLDTDDSFWLFFDDLMIGYTNSPYHANAKGANSEGSEILNTVYEAKTNRNILLPYGLIDDAKLSVDDTKINFGVLGLPEFKGYRVEKADVEVKTTADMYDTTYEETLKANGKYTYNVYAMYSDRDSEPVSITFDLTNLSTIDLEGSNALRVYPNPSNGMFIVEQNTTVTSFKAEVYNLAGQLIYQDTFNGNKAELNLMQYATGVYILNLVDDQGNLKTAKIIIK
ncbi:MAG: S8 family serine peptidase [Weeksellaceae bacterium]